MGSTNNLSEEASVLIKEITDSIQKLDDKSAKFKVSINDDYHTLDDIVSGIAKQQKELGNLEKLVQKSKSQASLKTCAELRSRLSKLKQQYTPETGSLFVRLFLGQVNVKQYRDGERFRLKQEYEKFKHKTSPQFLLFVVLIHYYPHPMFITAWQIWLLYYYITLALRENILRVNGSSIKSWWIYHHYLSMIGSLVMMLWPLDGTFTLFLPGFLLVSLFQGLVQTLINRYQQRQLYKLVAMGKANIMDVAGEATGFLDPGWAPSFMVLFPFLLGVQLLQLYEGLILLHYSYKGGLSETDWQVVASGLIFLGLASGNLFTTLGTYYQKLRNNKTD
eukprot:TRINITY_DN1645_c0_g1_i1.p1 TRINITY_DN1645_c0_g1~~TRINITY_DN1645_c0_g1_i1.p1  ORF type:complete len:334 (-),score=45.65 TRINITY_DN1645_c0_g1_i1:89-1090(-)